MGQQFLDLEGTKILANKIKEKAGYTPDYFIYNGTDKQTITKLITITPIGHFIDGVYKFQLASRIETIGDFEVYVSSGDDKYINVSIQYEGNSDIANRLRGYLFKNTSTQTTTFELYYIVKAWDDTKVYNKALNPRNFNLVYNMTNVSALPTNATTTITPVAKAWKGNSASATKLATARTINGVSFDGTKDITITDSTKVPNTGGNIKGKILISELDTLKDQAPGITLAIGDSDTGFKAPSDGNTEYWSNNVKQYNMKDVYHNGRKPTPSEIGASPSNHNHDDRYYTESEINNTLTTYQKAYTELSQLGLTLNNTLEEVIQAMANKSTFNFSFGEYSVGTTLHNQMPYGYGTLMIYKLDNSRTLVEYNTPNNNNGTVEPVTTKYYCNYNGVTKRISQWVVYATSNQISRPNILINGDFQVWQRGTSFTHTRTKYCADRWMMYMDGNVNGNVTWSKTSDGIKATCTNAITQAHARLWQPMDSIERAKLNGKDITYTIKYRSTTNKAYLLVCGIAQELPKSSSWNTVSVTSKYTNPNQWFVGVQFGESSYSMALNEYIEIAYIKAEVGEYATPFVAKTRAEELRDCSRYYAVVPISQNVITCDGNTQILTSLNYPVPMRVQPTATANSSIYFQKVNGGTPILLKSAGESVRLEAWKDYSTTCMCWIVNGTAINGISDGLLGTLNGADSSNNRLSGSSWIVLDAEIY